MRRADQLDSVLSTSEDSSPPLHSATAEPPMTRSGPISDSYVFQSAEEWRAPSSTQPSGPPCDKSRPNGVHPSVRSAAATAGQPDGKPHSRILKLFANPRSPTSAGGTRGPEQAWVALPGLGVVSSFKKLRSSVLQGIQSRGAASHGDEHASASNWEPPGYGLGGAARPESGDHVSFGEGRTVSAVSHCGSDHEDYEEEEVEEEEEADGLQRNARFSRSIRRAYGAGRIPLLDGGPDRGGGNGTHGAADSRTAAVGSEPPEGAHVKPGPVPEGANVSRLSRSAENLSVFKTPLRRKVVSPGALSPEPVSPGSDPPDEAPGLQRRASASSVDLQSRGVRRWRSPLKSPLRGPEHQLAGSIGDLRKRPGPSPTTPTSPTSPTSPISPLSRLHDDYSRRVPCLHIAERQRRPPPAFPRLPAEGGDGAAQEALQDTPFLHIPPVHPRPDAPSSPGQHRAPARTVPMEPSGGTEQAVSVACCRCQPATPASASSCALPAGWGSPPHSHREPPGCQEQTDTSQTKECICRRLDNDDEEATSDQQWPTEAALHAEESSPTATNTPPVSPTSPSKSHPSPTKEETTPSVNPRRRAGRTRPRPISDYGQLVSRKYPIPEEESELTFEEMASNGPLSQGSTAGCGSDTADNRSVGGDTLSRRRRPISVIGGVEHFSSHAPAEKEDSLPSPLSRPPVPSHDVPPYRAVSARLRPAAFSQSTPIGLDRVGRRKLHRVLSDGVSECSGVLDDGEEEGSFDELSDVTPYLQPGVELSVLNQWISSGHTVHAEALWDHVSMEEQELAFKAGDVIRVLDASHKDWWWGQGADREAWFPSSFVRVRVNQEDSGEESTESVVDQEEPSPEETAGSEHRQQMRTNVVQEIMNTERIYIKHLRDICEGYIRQCRKHPTMFTEPQLKTIFSNIEDIYRFQRQFLRDMEKKYNKDQPHLSEIGSCFLMQDEGFSIYSEYCNTHPAASAELQRLMKLGRYKHFFEACRLLQQMIDISIAGFLLTPVQKICKYPLQLGELLKFTPKDHSDYSGVSDAYAAMKNVASLINERKRRLESVDAIAHWQVGILHWEGADTLERSSELIHSGELTWVVRQGKTQQRSFFLFDHQLVFCKKDVLRRDLLHYRGRLDMDQTEVLELPDGRDPDLGLTLRNALRLRHASTLESLCILCCRKAQDKHRWLEAFAKERRRVQEDQEMGMEISEEQIKRAIFNARKVKQGKIKSIGYSGSIPPLHQNMQQNLHPLQQRHVTMPTSVPQQQVFSLAEPPKRKPSHLWNTITRNSFFRK